MTTITQEMIDAQNKRLHDGLADVSDGIAALKAERDRLREALRDIALDKPVSECQTFRPDLSGAHEHLNLLRDFARRALANEH